MVRGYLQRLAAFVGMASCVTLTSAQMYYSDDFSADTTSRYEAFGGGTWKVVNGELQTRDTPESWNCFILKPSEWKGWTDYTYEVTVTPDVSKRPALFLYQVFRYAQPGSLDRTDFFSFNMDEGSVVALYLDRFVGGVRTRPVPGTDTFAGSWKNEAKVYKLRLDVTKTSITGYLNGEKQFSFDDSSLADGRIGLGAWGADANFDDIKVHGPNVTAVEPAGKVASTWGTLKRAR